MKTPIIRGIPHRKRILWDLMVFGVIIFVAFEVPYDIFVGWQDTALKQRIDRWVTLIFILDILLNCLTRIEKSYGGFWGWRNIAGLFYYKWSPAYRNHQDPCDPQVMDTQPAIVATYLKSGWFLIDLLAVFPFELVLDGLTMMGMARTLRLVRIARLLRLLRISRILKTVKILSILDYALSHRPALRRMIIIAVFVPWLGHLHACVFYNVESNNNHPKIQSYSNALNHVFFAFAASEPEAETSTRTGYFVSVSAVMCGLTFLSILIGNFSALFEQMDSSQMMLEERVKKWEEMFLEYREIFDKSLRYKILAHLKHTSIQQSKLEDQAELIRGLDEQLEQEVKSKLLSCSEAGSSTPIRKLVDRLNQGVPSDDQA